MGTNAGTLHKAGLDAFAHDLHAFLATGVRVDASAGASRIA